MSTVSTNGHGRLPGGSRGPEFGQEGLDILLRKWEMRHMFTFDQTSLGGTERGGHLFCSEW